MRTSSHSLSLARVSKWTMPGPPFTSQAWRWFLSWHLTPCAQQCRHTHTPGLTPDPDKPVSSLQQEKEVARDHTLGVGKPSQDHTEPEAARNTWILHLAGSQDTAGSQALNQRKPVLKEISNEHLPPMLTLSMGKWKSWSDADAVNSRHNQVCHSKTLQTYIGTLRRPEARF